MRAGKETGLTGGDKDRVTCNYGTCMCSDDVELVKDDEDHRNVVSGGGR